MDEKQMAKWAEHLTCIGTDRESELGASWLGLQAKVAKLETRLCGGGGATKHDRIDVLEARVVELEGDRDKALDMILDRIDADPSTMTEAVDGLLKLYKMEFDERFKLQAQLAAERAKVAELEGEREPQRIAARKRERDALRKWHESEKKVAELEGDLQREHRYRAHIQNQLNDTEADHSESKDEVKDLQAQIDRATAKVDEYAAAVFNHVEWTGVCDDDSDDGHCKNAECSYCKLVRVVDSVLKLDPKPAEPRPMSEAPRDGTRIRVVTECCYVFVDRAWRDHRGDNVRINYSAGWLPTSSGGEGETTAAGGSEWQEHGEGWSDEAMLAGGSGEGE